MNAVVQERYASDFRDLETRLPGRDVPWLRRQRRDALAWFLDHGLPGRREEDWKYTDLAPLARHGLHPPQATGQATAADLAPHLLGQAHRLVFVDGRLAPHLSDLHRLPRGVRVTSLAEALVLQPGALEGHLGRYTPADMNGLTALNAALFADGAYVHVGRDVDLARPIHLIYLSSGLANGPTGGPADNAANNADGTAAHLRNVVVAAAGSRSVLVESYGATGQAARAYATNAVTEVVVEDNAALEHYKLQREAQGAFHLADHHVHLARNARYTGYHVATGARLARNGVHAVLDDEGAECVLNGLSLTGGRQHVDNHLLVEHRRPRGTSRQGYKGVLDDRSRAVFTGRVIVAPDAQHTDAAQRSDNLLLSPHAEADSRPQLEIYADDVKCSHGATVGQLDADALFYLRARGIDRALARNLLVYAFVGDVLARMGLRPVHDQLQRQITGRLLGAASLQEVL